MRGFGFIASFLLPFSLGEENDCANTVLYFTAYWFLMVEPNKQNPHNHSQAETKGETKGNTIQSGREMRAVVNGGSVLEN